VTALDIVTAPRANTLHWKAGKVTWEEIIAWLDNPASKKECGNYVLGTLRKTTTTHKGKEDSCTGLHRTKSAVVTRSVITLDVDSPEETLPDRIETETPWASIIHTTYSSAPDAIRLRVLFKTTRPLLPDEYVFVANALMEKLGAKQFDPGSSQPERYMFMPAAQEPEWFQSWVFDGDAVDVDEILEDYDPDLSDEKSPKPHHSKRDPFGIEGTIGAFNRVYPTVDAVAEAYDLPYEPAREEDRWQLVGSRSIAGVNEVSPGLFYSHHITDPAYGLTCSSFDLARLHLFGDLDGDVPSTTPVNRRPSNVAMLQLAARDHRVIAELVGGDFDAEMDDLVDNDWKLKLKLHPRTGAMLDDIRNWDLVKQHEPFLEGLFFNEFSLVVESAVDLPWRPLAQGGPTISSTDRASFCHHLERVYRLRPARSLVDELIDTKAHEKFVNPVKDYLVGLKWDGVPRVEECLPGVVPTDYTRMVARKALVAAVARALNPGCKWDHTLVLFGPEGLGKSWWVDKLALGYSASLGRIGDKDTLLTMQRSWIMVSDEGYSLRKAEADVQKEFLTRTEDVFRLPYDREAMAHPRHCVIWGTTNDEVFLRRQEGNRRFLIVRCTNKVDFDELTPEYINQLWAEAVDLYTSGELLFLTEEESQLASIEREEFTEEDALQGLVDEYLNTPVPSHWDELSPEARKIWLASRADGLVPEGDILVERTCSAQLWVEALGNRYGAHSRSDLLQINTVMKQLPNWRALPGRHRVPGYGVQLVFQRVDNSAEDPRDVL
jgi:hypothetical protein